MLFGQSDANNLVNHRLKNNLLKSSNSNFDEIARNNVDQNLDLPNIDQLQYYNLYNKNYE